MAVTHGNDPDVLEAIGDALRAEGERVQTIAGSGTSGIAVLVDAWAGPDLHVFDASWGDARQQLDAAAQLLRAVGERAKEQAQEQRDGSGEGGWAPSGLGHAARAGGDALPKTVPHSDADQGALEIPFPPGDAPWVPQGLGYSDEQDVYVHSIYNHDNSEEGRLAIQSADGKSVKFIEVDGNSHYGGVTVDGDNVYVSGNGTSKDSGSYITRYSLKELMAAEDGAHVDPIGDPVKVETGSTVTAHDGTLYVANFSKKAEDGPAMVYEYATKQDGSVIANDDPPSFEAPEGVQGITTEDGENFYYTKSNGSEHSDLIHGTRHDDDFTVIDDGLSPLSQGVIIRDGELVVTNESYSDEYRPGIEDSDSRWKPNFIEKPVKPDPTLQTYDVPTEEELALRRSLRSIGGW